MNEQEKHWKALDESAGGFMSRRERVRQMQELDSAAYENYKLNRDEEALGLWSQAFALAEALDDRNAMARYKRWMADCLRLLARLTEALASLAELEALQENPREQFLGLIHQLEVAIEIPIPLEKIRRILGRCREAAGDLGSRKSVSMICILESDLCRYRGDFPGELAQGQQALAVLRSGGAGPEYDEESYYRSMVAAYLNLADRENALLWLARYEALRTPFETIKALNLLAYRRRLARLEGQPERALPLAEEALLRAREAVRHPYPQLHNFIESCLDCARFPAARRALAELLLFWRHTEFGQRRYEIFRLCGDYHRAAALPGEAGADWHRARARKQYRRALELGRFLDGRLACSWREREILERLASLGLSS